MKLFVVLIVIFILLCIAVLCLNKASGDADECLHEIFKDYIDKKNKRNEEP